MNSYSWLALDPRKDKNHTNNKAKMRIKVSEKAVTDQMYCTRSIDNAHTSMKFHFSSQFGSTFLVKGGPKSPNLLPLDPQ